MIKIHYQLSDHFAGRIVQAGMIRSFTQSQIISLENENVLIEKMLVVINPRECDIQLVSEVMRGGGKVLLLGYLPPKLGQMIGLHIEENQLGTPTFPLIEYNPEAQYDVSKWGIYYARHELTDANPLLSRYLFRFDFAKEWNNQGYGGIGIEGPNDVFSLCQRVIAENAQPLAWVEDQKGNHITVYAALYETTNVSVLWFNRQVGPVDSLEWVLIETFFGDYRPVELPCLPYISEIPAGYNGAVTMRIDCDQAIASAEPLLELYREENVPFSLAIPTGLEETAADREIVHRTIQLGGCVVPHSVNHFPHWGGDYRSALREALESKKCLESRFPEVGRVDYLVSPFHQTPVYAAQAFYAAGYKGFIGGIIHDDPQFLMGRGGQIPFIGQELISHSQQCMLHGDCFHRYRNSVEPYKESFLNHCRGRSIFGYLDHPFSPQYQYGWENETERIAAHQDLIQAMKEKAPIWFCSINDGMNFLLDKSRMNVYVDKQKALVVKIGSRTTDMQFQIRWKKKIIIL